jgi:ABC-2 type transport system permease protein
VKTALLIARKDLTQRMRDRSVFIYGILAPLGLAFIFSFVFGPIERATFNVEYVVVNEDGGPIADAFLETLEGLEDAGFATIREAASAGVAEEQVARASDEFSNEGESASAAFIMPTGLSENVMAGEGAEIIVIGGAGTQLGSQIAYSVAQGFAAEVGAVEVGVRTVLALGGAADPESVGRVTQAAARTVSPITVEDISADSRQLKQTTYLAAGMSVFFLFFTVSFGVSGLLEERKVGTMDRLLAAPIDRRSIILGKAITSFVLGIVSMTVLAVASTLLLDAEWGNPLGVALLIVAVVIAAMGILGIVAATAKTQAQAENFQAIISLVLAFLGGTFFAVSQAGGWLAQLSLFTPHAWFLRGLGELQSGDVSAVFLPVGALLLFGLVTGGIAWPFLRRAVER